MAWSCAARRACTTSARSPRIDLNDSYCGGGIQGTSSWGAGVATTTTASTTSGCRAASANATLPPADHPTVVACVTPNARTTAAASSAADATVAQWPSPTGSDDP